MNKNLSTFKASFILFIVLITTLLLSSCTTTPPKADLKIAITSPSLALAGDDIGSQVSGLISNIGDEMTDGSVMQIDFVLSTDLIMPEGFAVVSTTFQEDALLVGGRDQLLTQIAAGSSSPLASSNLVIAPDTPAGDYFLCARVDSGDSIDESNENNNVACNAIEVTKPIEVIESSVSIISPENDIETNNQAFIYDGYDSSKGMWYKDVTLKGAANDSEDGALSGSALVWQTNKENLQDKTLGTGNTLTTRLYSNECFGIEHVITLSATDSDGNTISTERKIRIWTLC